MKILAIALIYLSYGMFVAMYNGEQTDEQIFPTFASPAVEFEEIPSGCGGFGDCLEYIGRVITNIVLAVVFVVLFLAALIVFFAELLVIIGANAFEGVEGAPQEFNILVLAFFGLALGIAIFRAFRKGDTAA